jgi:hypothetical protein
MAIPIQNPFGDKRETLTLLGLAERGLIDDPGAFKIRWEA